VIIPIATVPYICIYNPPPSKTTQGKWDMNDELVMRSFYISVREDARLRKLAFELELSKSDLVRAAITQKLSKWDKKPDVSAIRDDNDLKLILDEINLGNRQAALADPHMIVHELKGPKRSRRGASVPKQSATAKVTARRVGAGTPVAAASG
jgi:hypothetical protein